MLARGCEILFWEITLFWKNECNVHFPHYFIDLVAKKGEPKSWYLVFKKIYIYEYGLEVSNSLVPTLSEKISASELAALFTAAKRGDAVEFKKLHQEEYERLLRSHKTKKSHVFYTDACDRSGHLCYYWLYKNGYQAILNNIFSDLDPNASKKGKFYLAILCNQQNYLAEHAEDFSGLTPKLYLGIQLGSLSLINLLFEKFKVRDMDIEHAFIGAASFDYADIVEFLHAKIEAHYEVTMYLALRNAITNERKEVVEKLLSICRKDKFDINYIPPPDKCENSILACAAENKDPVYVKMILEAGANPIPGNKNFNAQRERYSPIECCVYKGFYETLTALLQGGAAFHDYDYIRVKDWMNDTHNDTEGGVKRPETPEKISLRIKSLVELMLYKHEVKAGATAVAMIVLSFLSDVFHVEKSSQDNDVQLKACEVLFDVVIRKCPTTALDALKPLEKQALENKESRLSGIYQNLLGEIQKIKKEEAAVEVRQSVDLNQLN